MKRATRRFASPLLPLVALLTQGSIYASQSGTHADHASASAVERAIQAALVFGDVNRDGLDDVFVADPRGETRLWMNSGRGPLARWIAGQTSAAISPGNVTPGGTALPGAAVQYCAPDVFDQGGGPCITASSVPTLGSLFPMSADLNVSGSGDVGIGTTTPVTKLTVVAATGNATIISALSGNSFFNAGIDVGRLTGEFSIGVARDANNWVTGSLEGDTALRVNDGAKKIHLACGGGGAVPTMSVAGDGVGIGTITATPGFLLDVAGNVRCVSLTQTSARELKQDIAPIHGALDSILKLQGVTYSWNEKAPESVQGHCDIGFLADEVDAVLPAIVAKDENGKAIGLDYGKIAPVAVEAIKELKSENDALKARLEKLEAVLAASGK